MALELTDEQRTKVIKLIKEHIAQKGNCRVGWALREAAGPEFEKSIHVQEKIANSMLQSGRYCKEASAQVPGDWNIFVNPQFRLFRLNQATVVANVLLGITTIVVTILTKGCCSTGP